MIKPKWEDAPIWAEWLAADGSADDDNAFWVFFESKPKLQDWHGGTWLAEGGKWLETEFVSSGASGESSLEPRP